MGDILVCAIAAGLHRQPDYGPNVKVTTASEFKRIVFSAIFSADKNMAALNGTPPALSRLNSTSIVITWVGGSL